MKRDLAVILYKIFLIVLVVTQLYPIFFEELTIFDRVSHYVISIYILFRLYIFTTLKDKARALDLTLTEFLTKRDKCIND